MLILCIYVVIMAGLTEAFKPNSGFNDDKSMYTHMKITEEALDIVAANFLTPTDQEPTTGTNEYDFLIKSHFGKDSDSYEKYKKKARQFASAVSTAYKTYKLDPDYTVNSERIREAHTLVLDTRLEIGTLLSGRPILTVNDVSVLIQSFYSSTNWVEMNGAGPYSDFGSLGTQDLMRIAASDEKTCRSCDYTALGSCNDNLLVHDRLTSGYWSGQSHSPKPSAGSGETEGKCSHGGPLDSGKDTPATGGINKATTDLADSPHYHLHREASEAAVQATVEFFIHQTNGILTSVSNHMISQLIGLELKSTPSLGFAVDVTGSMRDDISAVKAAIKKKAIESIDSGPKPGKYVLSTFSDPVSLTRVSSTTDANEMIRWIDDLIVSGGGDCPEYAISGLQKAIDFSEPYSKIFLATDADAEDSSDSNTAMNAATTKHITVEFLLTDTDLCGRKRRDVSRRHKRDLASYQSIAAGTGGGVYQIGTSELFAVLDRLLEDNFASSKAVVDYFVQTTAESDTMDIYVDSGADNLVIDIDGAYSLYYASLTDPTGTVEGFSTDNTTLYIYGSKMTMVIKNPVPGTWVLSRLLSRQWEVNITVSSTLDINYQLIETDDSGIHYVSERNPIIGKNYTLAVIAYNLNASSTSFAVNLLDEDGTVTYTTPVIMTFEASKTIGYTPIVIPDTNFYVQLSGVDQNGFQFKRMVGTLITPVAVDLFVQPIFGSLAIGTPQDITYTLNNLGGSTETYTVMIVDDKGRVLSPTSRDHSVSAGDNVTENFQLSSSTELEQITYTVSVTTLGSPEVLQSTTYTAMVTGPFCTSFMTSSVCTEVDTASGNCSSVTWSATAVFSFDIWVYMAADDVTVTVDTADRTRLHITGTCCVANFTVNASPATGSGCRVTGLVTARKMLQSVDNDDTSGKDDDDSYLTEDTGTNIGLIVGVLMGVGVLVLAVTGLLKYVTRKKDAAINDSVVDFEVSHADTSSRTHFDSNLLNPKALEAMFTASPPQATTLNHAHVDQHTEKARRQLFDKSWK